VTGDYGFAALSLSYSASLSGFRVPSRQGQFSDRGKKKPNRGASRISADFYGKTRPFGLISAGFGPFMPLGCRYGVLTWCTSRNARHVFRRVATFHAVNRPFIPRVGMACNTPTCGYPDWLFIDFTITPIWRAYRYRKFPQRSGMHPDYVFHSRLLVVALADIVH
jgi:hypothetical protein